MLCSALGSTTTWLKKNTMQCRNLCLTVWKLDILEPNNIFFPKANMLQVQFSTQSLHVLSCDHELILILMSWTGDWTEGGVSPAINWRPVRRNFTSRQRDTPSTTTRDPGKRTGDSVTCGSPLGMNPIFNTRSISGWSQTEVTRWDWYWPELMFAIFFPCVKTQ